MNGAALYGEGLRKSRTHAHRPLTGRSVAGRLANAADTSSPGTISFRYCASPISRYFLVRIFCDRRPGPVPGQRGIGGEDPVVQVGEFFARVDPELFTQHAADIPERRQRLGLAVRAIQGEHELVPQPFAQRVLRGEAAQLRDKFCL